MGIETRIEKQAANGQGTGVGSDLSLQAQDLMKEVANQKKPLPNKDVVKGPETDPEIKELKDKMHFEKQPPVAPAWFKGVDTNKDGALSLAEVEKRIATMPHYKCVTEESSNLYRMRDNFATIAGDDNKISFPELYAYNKQHPSRSTGCGAG